MAGGISELQDEVIKIKPELKDDFTALQNSLQKIEQAEKPANVKDSGPMNKIRRFLKEAEDTGSQLGKSIDKVKAGYSIMQDVAENYNKLAQWCGMPVVPSIFLKKQK